MSFGLTELGHGEWWERGNGRYNVLKVYVYDRVMILSSLK